jgi:Zn-dependent protease with chaperone function
MVSAAGLAINDATGTAIDTWPAADVALVDRPQAGLPLRLGRLGNPQVRLIIQDRAALAELSAHCPNLRRRVRLDRRSAARLGALLVAAALSVAALVHFVIPEIATQVARSMPPQLERRIGEGVADQLALLMGAIEGRRRALACAAPSGVAALEALLARLAPARQSAEGREGASDPGPDLPPTVRVLDARLVNAFALPGAVIVLPRGMIDFSRSPDELAGVLAHELGHIALRHPIETLIKVAGVSTLFSLLIGDVTGGAVIVALGEYMIRVSYTRPVEQAADAYAVAALHRAAIDPAATAAAFARLLPKGAAGGALERALSTHPPTEDRVALFRAAAREGQPALSAGEWAALKAICAEKAQSRANG